MTEQATGAGRFIRSGFIRRHLPSLTVGMVIAVAAVLVATDRWRRGAFILGIAAMVAAALRLMVPSSRLGLLAVRGRTFDVCALVATGAAILALAATIDPLGTR